MKVTVVTNIYPNAKNLDSGTYVYDQVNSLKSLVNPTVVCKTQDSIIGFIPFAARTIWRLMAAKDDLVHAHYGFHSGILPALMARRPLVVTFHGSDALFEPSRNKLYNYLQRLVVANATKLVAVSKQVAGELVGALGAREDKVCIIPCGVDTDMFQARSKTEARRRLGLKKDANLVLFIGRLTREKGVDLIREASLGLPATDFCLIGEGPIKWQAANCRFAGVIEHRQIPDWMNAADALILPSLTEGTPVVILEALASEVPVICSDVGACSELISGSDCGVLIPPGDSSALVRAIENVLTSKKDFDSKRGRRLVLEEYDLKVISQRLYKVYEDAINQSK